MGLRSRKSHAIQCNLPLDNLVRKKLVDELEVVWLLEGELAIFLFAQVQMQMLI